MFIILFSVTINYVIPRDHTLTCVQNKFKLKLKLIFNSALKTPTLVSCDGILLVEYILEWKHNISK